MKACSSGNQCGVGRKEKNLSLLRIIVTFIRAGCIILFREENYLDEQPMYTYASILTRSSKFHPEYEK